MSNNRSAVESMNGFFYQRYYCIHNILHKTDFEYILEEGYEDIDLIKHNSQRDIIQIKCHGNSIESLTYNSGLYKVIVSNFERDDIDNIFYSAFNLNEQFFQEKLENAFINKKYYNIGKYILLLRYNNNNELSDKIHFNINDIDKIDSLYISYKDEILKKPDKFFLFFDDENNCNNYLSKFKLEKGLSYNNLNESINKKIAELFHDFINTNNDENKKLRIELIKNTILNILTDIMFNKKSTERIIKYDDIIIEINKNIKTYTDQNNLYYELLKQNEKIITNTINNLIEINKKNNTLDDGKKININMFLNQIKNIKINSFDNVSFYVSLLNKHFKYLDKNDINFIRIYLIELIIKNISDKNNIVDKLNLFKYIGYIASKKIDNEYKISESKIIKFLDPTHKINIFFN